MLDAYVRSNILMPSACDEEFSFAKRNAFKIFYNEKSDQNLSNDISQKKFETIIAML